MAKIEKKSITDLIAAKPAVRKPTADEIDRITQEIHETPPPPPAPLPTKRMEDIPSPEEKIKRISVNAPVTLYLKAKTKATLQDQTLMAYIIGLMEKDLN